MPSRQSVLRERRVFINIPFDHPYERLYIALIAGLGALGLLPQSVLQIPPSENRLNRIFALLQKCGSSISDLSRIELDRKAPRTPRFNMPFEAGLALALSLLGKSGQLRRRHRPFIFEAKKYRLQKSTSDLNGVDPCLHGGTPVGMLRALTKAFQRQGERRTVQDLLPVYHDLWRFSLHLKRANRLRDLFDGVSFRQLSHAARQIAGRRHLLRS